MPKEKEKAGDTPEELNMLFRKNRIYMLDFEHRTRKMYAYAYAAAASEGDIKRVEEIGRASCRERVSVQV